MKYHIKNLETYMINYIENQYLSELVRLLLFATFSIETVSAGQWGNSNPAAVAL